MFMKVSDLENNIATSGIGQAVMGQTRKPKLTLKHIRKLRKIRELKSLELANQSRQLELIYSVAADAGENPGF